MDVSEISSRVYDVESITVTDKKCRVADSLKYYEGFVKLTHSETSRKAYILGFDDESDAVHLYGRLSLVNSPFIVRPIGYGLGVERFKNYSFLAVQPFSCTFSQFASLSSNVIEKKRFTNNFIKIISDTVEGLKLLHKQGFYCPDLKKEHIFIYYNKSNLTARIWKFCLAGSEKDQWNDWKKLGSIIEAIADSHYSLTAEIQDLCTKLKNGSLKGMKILKQSALLSFRKKFEMVLALNMFVSVRSSLPPDPKKAHIVAILDRFLTDPANFEGATPLWITKRRCYKKPLGNTGRHFIEKLRDLIEHEDEYIPPKGKQNMLDIQLVGRDPDLEVHIRQAWTKLFLKVQNFAADLGLKY